MVFVAPHVIRNEHVAQSHVKLKFFLKLLSTMQVADLHRTRDPVLIGRELTFEHLANQPVLDSRDLDLVRILGHYNLHELRSRSRHSTRALSWRLLVEGRFLPIRA